MEKEFLKFINDKNIFIDNSDELYITIYSYNYNTLDNPRKTQKYFGKLKRYKKDILRYFNKQLFICRVDSYNIDGLDESNSLLLFDDSKLYCNY